MKTGSMVLTALLAATLLSGCDKPGDGGSSDAKAIRVGATGLSFPTAYKKDGKLVGFDVELTEQIAKDLHYRVEWVNADFSGLMGQLEGGKLDTVANAVAITPARREKYDFSGPYSYYGSQLVTSSTNTNINTLDDLKGKTVAGVLGSNHVANLKKAFGDNTITIRTYENRDGAMTDTMNKRVDAYVNARPILLAEIKAKSLPLKLVGAPLVVEPVGYPFHKDDSGRALKSAFDRQIDAMRADGRLKTLSIKYFGEDITTPPAGAAH
ncbi:amino acid ABC transporter substrate-binding protein [Sodalis sp. C49]|uniref:amino acid ABC transporter substrate-binding protein n=1 Tax=unclassified Sodalis (in: enterobacteria) TaxID=2636512 RepID=UPI003965CB8D